MLLLGVLLEGSALLVQVLRTVIPRFEKKRVLSPSIIFFIQPSPFDATLAGKMHFHDAT